MRPPADEARAARAAETRGFKGTVQTKKHNSTHCLP